MFVNKRVSVILSDEDGARFLGLREVVTGEGRWAIDGRGGAVDASIGVLIEIKEIINPHGESVGRVLAKQVVLIPWSFITTVRLLGNEQKPGPGFKVGP
jgi:hypothetical protein